MGRRRGKLRPHYKILDVLLKLFGRKSFNVHVWSNRARLMGVKVDMGATVEHEAHWPQTKVWSLGLWLQEGTAVIEEPEEFTV